MCTPPPPGMKWSAIERAADNTKMWQRRVSGYEGAIVPCDATKTQTMIVNSNNMTFLCNKIVCSFTNQCLNSFATSE